MRISPKYDVAGGLGDLWTEIRRPQPYRIPIILASCAFPAFFLYFFAQERVIVPPKPPEVVYITTFAPDRTDAEIVASNIANQERKEARQRLLDARIEKRREMYRALGKATGIDTDKMEAEIAEQLAREEAIKQAQLEKARAAAAQEDTQAEQTSGGSVDDAGE
ncbi:hypothetical protein [Alteriqipengyuania lutimaris]|uniref:hypothetical protein n=1 Tax=Alteriqipengyuania lutimaris TaxID=1538146 RepID=UPI001853ED21|nr:hypothetical protein [Alteriqipengyuania lutimaris]MBB3033647.1 hypothetical protein [Alteriqipengyuania lutimaris]